MMDPILGEYFPYQENNVERAIRENKKSDVETLLEQNPDLLESINTLNDTPLHYAVRCGHVSLVAQWYERYPDMRNKKNSGLENPCDLAVAYGHEGVFRFFLDKNPDFLDVVDVDQGHKTLAHKAAESGHEAIVACVLERSPELIHALDVYDNTVLHAATCSGNLATTALVLKKKPESLFMWDQWNMTPAHWAIVNASDQKLAMFLQHAPQLIHLRSPLGETLLHKASTIGCLEAIELLLKVSNEQLWDQDRSGNTALHDAVINESPGRVACLLRHGAPVNLQNADGNTALHCISMTVGSPLFSLGYIYKKHVMELLIEAGADPDLQNQSGESAFNLACPNHKKIISDALEHSTTHRFKKRSDALLLDVLINRAQAELNSDRTPCILASLPDEMLKAIVSHSMESHEELGSIPLPSDFNKWFATSFHNAKNHAVGRIQEQCASAVLYRRGNTTVERMVTMGQQQAEEARLHDLHEQGTHQLVLYRAEVATSPSCDRLSKTSEQRFRH